MITLNMQTNLIIAEKMTCLRLRRTKIRGPLNRDKLPLGMQEVFLNDNRFCAKPIQWIYIQMEKRHIERGPTCLFATEIKVVVCADACGAFFGDCPRGFFAAGVE